MVPHGWWWDTAQEILELVTMFRGRLDELRVSTKPDNTLLTEADIAVQELVIRRIREFDPVSPIVAEEEGQNGQASGVAGTGVVWIVDPIDGTSQFVQPTAVEFCTVLARYEAGHPSSALVVAPELGSDRAPVVIVVSLHDDLLTVNGEAHKPATRELTGRASTTRSANSTPSDIEKALLARQYHVKTRTTSQTLDMVRTALDLTAVAPNAEPFDLFHRRRQKLWDGAAGICLATAVGLAVSDETGDRLLPLSPSLLGSSPPVLPSLMTGHGELVHDVIGDQGCSAHQP
jgi:3'(2'), 5'-bisphosphate nucleotidase